MPIEKCFLHIAYGNKSKHTSCKPRWSPAERQLGRNIWGTDHVIASVLSQDPVIHMYEGVGEGMAVIDICSSERAISFDVNYFLPKQRSNSLIWTSHERVSLFSHLALQEQLWVDQISNRFEPFSLKYSWLANHFTSKPRYLGWPFWRTSLEVKMGEHKNSV